MKVVVVGGNGLIGSRVVTLLHARGHRTTVAAPATEAESATGRGLAELLVGAQIVIDVAEPPSFAYGATWDFYTSATANLLTAEEEAGVAHHVALSEVGAGEVAAGGYFRAKSVQERIIGEAAVNSSIVRATVLYESVGRLADSATYGDKVRISPALTQPVAADDVATAIAHIATGRPVCGVSEVAGPDRYPLDQLVRSYLRAHHDTRRVIAEPQATYFGASLNHLSLLPGPDATVFTASFTDWLDTHMPAPVG